jgi:hypothetical protein
MRDASRDAIDKWSLQLLDSHGQTDWPTVVFMQLSPSSGLLNAQEQLVTYAVRSSSLLMYRSDQGRKFEANYFFTLPSPSGRTKPWGLLSF